MVAVVGPLLTALLAGAGILLKGWRSRRRWEHRRDEIIEQGRRQVAFISDWVAAFDHLTMPETDRTSATARAQRDLEAVYVAVTTQTRTLVEHRPVRRTRADYARIVLLSGVRRPWAKVSRVAYLAVLAFALLSGALMTSLSFGLDDVPLSGEIGIAVFATGLYLAPAAVLHVVTRYLDRPGGNVRTAPDHAPSVSG
ncbi:hypothetical protein [Ornithinimicrobium cerasi]|uniref:hypothetical protein n=1 Tax=Ornithinimicrobium cerasi TaxID=2248773 RepID=UPI000F005A0C|nr:hypothetical protein [Ornithinimicrobium cerasi]